MASRTESSSLDALLRWLVAHRLAIYLLGLLAIVAPRALRTFTSVSLGPTARTVIVVASLGAMILTYLGEQRLSPRVGSTDGTSPSSSARSETESGAEPEPASGTNGPSADSPQYSRRTRAIFAASVLGVIFGVYVTLEASLPAGLLFVVGAILFGQSAYRRERGGEDHGTSGDTGGERG